MKLIFGNYIAFFLLFVSCTPVPPRQTLALPKFAERPKNLVLLIGDGMGLAQVSAAMYQNQNQLYLEQFSHIGFHKSYSSSDLITDSAAGATAFAIGKKTFNNAIGIDKDSLLAETLMEEAKRRQFATGIVTSTSLVHATPAAFVAHQKSRAFTEQIAADIAKQEVDLLIGGGKKYFERRSDERDLIAEMTERGYRFDNYFNRSLDAMKFDPEYKYVYFTSDSEPLSVVNGRDYLPYACRLAPYFLKQRSENGFFLVIESGKIDILCHANQGGDAIKEVLDFNLCIEKILQFAQQDRETLVIVTADHETGGMAINPGSDMKHVQLGFTTKLHTAQLVPVYAYGPKADLFSGIYENTAIYHKIREALHWKTPNRRRVY